MRSVKKFIACLTMISMLSSQISSGQEIKSLDFSCLTRDQKEEVVVCFDERAQCGKDLMSMEKTDTIVGPWEAFFVGIAAGLLGGVALSKQFNK